MEQRKRPLFDDTAADQPISISSTSSSSNLSPLSVSKKQRLSSEDASDNSLLSSSTEREDKNEERRITRSFEKQALDAEQDKQSVNNSESPVSVISCLPYKHNVDRELSQAFAASLNQRLKKSSITVASQLTLDWVKHRLKRYFNYDASESPDDNPPSDDQLHRGYRQRLREVGTVKNKRVYVALSKVATTMAAAHDVVPVGAPSSDRLPNLQLGLFAGQKIKAEEYACEYGGVLEWALKARTQDSHNYTHIRRIPDSDHVYNGRPFALLFPRIFSVLQHHDSIALKPNCKTAYRTASPPSAIILCLIAAA